MAAAQHWSRKRGWAAAFQGAEVVGEHHAANRGRCGDRRAAAHQYERADSSRCWQRRRSLHQKAWSILCITCEAAFSQDTLTPCSSTVYLEPGMRASGLNLWLLEMLAACILCFNGPGSQWETGIWSRRIWPRPAGSTRSTAKCSPHRQQPVQEGAGAVLDYFVLSEEMAHLVQQVEVVDNSPHCSTFACQSHSHSHVLGSQGTGSKTAKAVLHGGASGTATPGGAFLLDLGSRGSPCRPGAGVVGGLRAAEAAWCRIHDLCVTQRRPFLGRSKGLVIEHVSHGQATRNDTRRRCSKKAAAWRALRRLAAQAVGRTSLPSLSLPDPGIFRRKKLWHTLRKAATCGDLAFKVTRVMVFIKSHTQQAVNAAAVNSARCWRQWAKQACQGSAGAAHVFPKVGLDNGEGGGLAGLQAAGQANGDVFGALVGFAQSQRQAAGRPGWCGRAFAKTFTRRGRRCVQDIQEHRWIRSRLHQPQGNFAAARRFASMFHRLAHGFRGKAGQTFVLVSHDGFEA